MLIFLFLFFGGGGIFSYHCLTDPVKKLVNRFDFSACYDEQSTQQEIFDNEVKQMVLGVFSGVVSSPKSRAPYSTNSLIIILLGP